MSSKKRLKSIIEALKKSSVSVRILALVAIFASSILFYGFADADTGTKSIVIIDGEQHYEIVMNNGTVVYLKNKIRSASLRYDNESFAFVSCVFFFAATPSD